MEIVAICVLILGLAWMLTHKDNREFSVPTPYMRWNGERITRRTLDEAAQYISYLESAEYAELCALRYMDKYQRIYQALANYKTMNVVNGKVGTAYTHDAVGIVALHADDGNWYRLDDTGWQQINSLSELLLVVGAPLFLGKGIGANGAKAAAIHVASQGGGKRQMSNKEAENHVNSGTTFTDAEADTIQLPNKYDWEPAAQGEVAIRRK